MPEIDAAMMQFECVSYDDDDDDEREILTDGARDEAGIEQHLVQEEVQPTS